MPRVDEEAFRDHQSQPARDRPASCTQRLAFTDFTPPDAGVDQAEPGKIFSPNTLQSTVRAGFTAPPLSPEAKKPKKHRKRKGRASNSQPAPQIRGLEDKVPLNEEGYPRVHETGKPILDEDSARLAEGKMIALQNSIMFLEERLLKEKKPNYPAFAVKVPPEMVNFVQQDPAEVFFIAYEDIFDLFHEKRMDYNLVRLFALDQAMKIRRDAIPHVTVVDPYYMRDSHLSPGSKTREAALEYLTSFFLANKDKTAHLLPFFFE